MSVSSPFLHLLLPFCSFFSILIIFPFSLFGETRVAHSLPLGGGLGRGLLGLQGEDPWAISSY